jgi:hypothetical protein
MRHVLLVACLVACPAPPPEREELYGLWGRIDDGRFDIFEFEETIDATGLTEVRPAYRRYRYRTTEVPTAVEGGRWIVIGRDLIVNAAWATDETPTNRNRVYEILAFEPREILLQPPGDDEPLIYTTLSRLPTAAID